MNPSNLAFSKSRALLYLMESLQETFGGNKNINNYENNKKNKKTESYDI